ncbi:hypothetical protein WN944_018656 [Citrus x changshan-huyou]|uniref:Uncharacterized protein n=1 Tax=Citrus x changshan-huyou TaxID=2935761 RepID=A0AAP0QFM5_9ROSI
MATVMNSILLQSSLDLRAGTGNPFFTIDAAAALRASERKLCAS